MEQARRPLDPEAILAATEQILRRHGPEKTSVVDVARVLGVSHAAVYKHFASKQALREAVAKRWLGRDREALAVVADDNKLSPADRLRGWLHAVLTVKQAKLREDPELFGAYVLLASTQAEVAVDHVADLLGQLTSIVAAGAADGTFATSDAAATARTIFHATSRFTHIAFAGEWLNDGIENELDAVCTLLLDGLRNH
ncbi:TetR family transcriptional regulator [Kribbella sp. NBC_01505]|uniref:TetR/AcrR family transcriptional regulator n=1 Tax=Kribbella sp. NBC_01505 TaxID=2903580 RepID=UPI00386BF842